MGKNVNKLFSIGDVAAVCSVTRRTILHYQSKGLLNPSLIDKSSGYRYYSTQDVANLLLVLELKNSGLSLDEIAEYLSGKDVAEKQIARLEAQKEKLTQGIAQLRSRQVKKGDYTVEWISLPRRLCYLRSFICNGVEDGLNASYQTVSEAIGLGLRFSTTCNSFCEFPDNGYLQGMFDLQQFSMNVCITIEPEEVPESCVIYPAQSAVAVHHRGAYQEIGAAYFALRDYILARNLIPTAPVQEIYIESTAALGDKEDNYITKVIQPIEDKRKY